MHIQYSQNKTKILPKKDKTYHSNKFKHLYNGRVHQIVAGSIVEKCFDNWFKQKTFHYVAVVKFIFQANNLSLKTKST